MRRFCRATDPVLCILCLVAAALGCFFVIDAGYPGAMRGDGVFRLCLTEGLGLAAALAGFLIATRISEQRWRAWGVALFLVSLVACFLVFIPHVGVTLNGARRWLAAPMHISLQPSEFFKIGVILLVALLMEKLPKARPAHLRNIPQPWGDRIVKAIPYAAVILGAVVIEREPDLGTAVVVVGIFLGMLWIGGASHKLFLSLAACTAIVVLFLVLVQPYRIERFITHEHRWEAQYGNGIGFQSTHAEACIGMGGASGGGIGMGIGKYSLPAATSDFIFVTIAEETGFPGAIAVLLLLGAISARLFWLAANRAPTRFAALVTSGLGWWIGLQAALNLIMVTGLIPPVGIPLPMFSAGGSSLLAMGIGLGIVQAALAAPRKEVTADEVDSLRWRDRRPRLSGTAPGVRRGLSGM